jgi:hypothetical protein
MIKIVSYEHKPPCSNRIAVMVQYIAEYNKNKGRICESTDIASNDEMRNKSDHNSTQKIIEMVLKYLREMP